MRVLYIQYANPAAYPPVEHSVRILAAAGCHVRLIGVSTGTTDGIELPLPPNVEMVRLQFCAPGWRQKLQFVKFVFLAIWHAIRWRPHWIYASDAFACPAACLLSAIGFRVVYHEHDAPRFAASDQARSASLYERVIAISRLAVAHDAVINVVPNEARAALFRAETCTSRPVKCVWNCPAHSDAADTVVKPDGGLVISYHGSIVPARVPLSLLRALTLMQHKSTLRIIGYGTIGHPDYINTLKAEVARLQLADRVQFFAAAPRSVVLSHARQAHVGASFMPKDANDVNERHMVGASNKAFEYLACGAALLVPNTDEWVRTFVQPGYGLACDPDDAASIAVALDRFAGDIGNAIEMGDRGRRRVSEEWNYEAQFAKVLSKLVATRE